MEKVQVKLACDIGPIKKGTVKEVHRGKDDLYYIVEGNTKYHINPKNHESVLPKYIGKVSGGGTYRIVKDFMINGKRYRMTNAGYRSVQEAVKDLHWVDRVDRIVQPLAEELRNLKSRGEESAEVEELKSQLRDYQKLEAQQSELIRNMKVLINSLKNQNDMLSEVLQDRANKKGIIRALFLGGKR